MHQLKHVLQEAVNAQIISVRQSEQLIELLKKTPQQEPAFNITNILYYLGGLIAIGAMSLLMGLSWQMYGALGVFLLSSSYFILALGITHTFNQKNLFIPAGVCAALAIFLVPLMVYSVQKMLGFWFDDSFYHEPSHRIQWHWLNIELITLIAAFTLLRIYRFPFIMLPISIILWYLAIDLSGMLFNSYDWDLLNNVSLFFGLGLTILAFIIDIRSGTSKDYAFWFYIFGVITFWGGFTAQDLPNESSKLLYMVINLVMIFLGVVINRKIFVIIGALGCSYYLSHLAYQVFKNSYLFPIILSFIGLGIIYLGVAWQKNEVLCMHYLHKILPLSVRQFLNSKK